MYTNKYLRTCRKMGKYILDKPKKLIRNVLIHQIC